MEKDKKTMTTNIKNFVLEHVLENKLEINNVLLGMCATK